MGSIESHKGVWCGEKRRQLHALFASIALGINKLTPSENRERT